MYVLSMLLLACISDRLYNLLNCIIACHICMMHCIGVGLMLWWRKYFERLLNLLFGSSAAIIWLCAAFWYSTVCWDGWVDFIPTWCAVLDKVGVQVWWAWFCYSALLYMLYVRWAMAQLVSYSVSEWTKVHIDSLKGSGPNYLLFGYMTDFCYCVYFSVGITRWVCKSSPFSV